MHAVLLPQYTIFFQSVCFHGILRYRNALLTMAGGASREDRHPSAQRHGGGQVAPSGLSALLRATITSNIPSNRRQRQLSAAGAVGPCTRRGRSGAAAAALPVLSSLQRSSRPALFATAMGDCSYHELLPRTVPPCGVRHASAWGIQRAGDARCWRWRQQGGCACWHAAGGAPPACPLLGGMHGL